MRLELHIPPLKLSPEVWSRLGFKERALIVALQEVKIYKPCAEDHKHENRVFEMLRRACEAPHRPWSAAFVAWCLAAADYRPSEIQYLGSALSWITWGKVTHRLKRADPQRGDLFFFDRAGARHLGFVMGRLGDRFVSLEGNVFPDGRLDGPVAASVLREIDEPDGYIELNTPAKTISAAA